MVVVSNGRLDHAAEVQNFLRAIIMSAQPVTTTNPSTIIRTDWRPSTQQQPQPQQQLQIQQPQQTQQTNGRQSVETVQANNINNNNGNNQTVNQKTFNSNKIINQQTAHAQLIWQPNSHPFQNRTIALEPGKETKVGRSVARNRVFENNAIFDCKVLSRNHAVLFYTNGQFFIKDTGSSNGTFINGNRLSLTSLQSEPFEVRSGDIVQFGVDVMENSKKETHGCIVALLKLYLPDGAETKGSQLNQCVTGDNITTVDLLRLNRYIQEAVEREHVLESKLLKLQKVIELTRKSSKNSWQAMIDEDRLLSRIDMLETKLKYFQKNFNEDKLREDVLKLLEDKTVYQDSAKEALRKVHEERLDAVQKLLTIERALCSSEDECSLLRDQLLKMQQNLQEITSRLTMADAKCNELTEKYETKCNEYKEKCSQMDADSRENDTKSKIAHWLENSELKNLKEFDKIVGAIYEDDNDNTNEDPWNIEIRKKSQKNTRISDKLKDIERKLSIFNDNKIRALNNGDSPPPLELTTITTFETTMGDDNENNENNPDCTEIGDTKNEKDLLNDVLQELKDTWECIVNFNEKSLEVEERNALIEQMQKMHNQLTSTESELDVVKSELEMRPTHNQYQEKIKINDELQLQIQNIQSHSEQLQRELDLAMMAQTDNASTANKIDHKIKYLDVNLQTESNEIGSTPGTKQLIDLNTMDKETLEDLQFINDPRVQQEEELVAYKEECARLSDKVVELRKQLNEIQTPSDHLFQPFTFQIFIYIAPLLAIIVYLLLWPYL